MTVTIDEMSGLRKAAVLLVQIGKERSAQVLKSLRESEIEVLTAEIARLEDDRARRRRGGAGGVPAAGRRAPLLRPGRPRRTPRRSWWPPSGRTRPVRCWVALKAVLVEMPFQFLRRVDPPDGAVLPAGRAPADDHARPRAHGPRSRPRRSSAGWTSRSRRTSPTGSRSWSARHPTSSSRWSPTCSDGSRPCSSPTSPPPCGGLQPLVDIINHSDRNTERLILEGLEQRSTELAEEVRARMFVFEDVDTARRPRRADPAALGRQQGPGRGAQGRQGRGPRQDRLQHVGAGRPQPGRGHGRARTRPGQAGGGGAGRASSARSARWRSPARSWSRGDRAMTSSSEGHRTVVLRGLSADGARPARISADLRTSPFVARYGADPRLVDPVLEAVVADAERQAARAGLGAGAPRGVRRRTFRGRGPRRRGGAVPPRARGRGRGAAGAAVVAGAGPAAAGRRRAGRPRGTGPGGAGPHDRRHGRPHRRGPRRPPPRAGCCTGSGRGPPRPGAAAPAGGRHRAGPPRRRRHPARPLRRPGRRQRRRRRRPARSSPAAVSPRPATAPSTPG